MNRNSKLLALATIIICIIMVFAGLKPKGFRLYNTASWLKQTNGIRFGRLGIAYSSNSQSPAPESLSIELAITPPAQRRDRLALIIDLWDVHGPRHVALCQWDSTLLVMKSFSRYFKNSRLQLGKSVSPGKTYHITITSRRNNGTDFYLNGIRVKSTCLFDLCDSGISLGRLALGNSSDAQNPWNGKLYAFSMCNKVFNDAQIQERFNYWIKTGSLTDQDSAIAAYPFSERRGQIAHDRGRFGDLHIPTIFYIPQKQILRMPWDDFRFDKSYASDVVINLVGFIPLGLFFSAFLWSIGGSARRHRFIICVLVGGSISLFFELVQVYIPTRSSQMSDLITNILGTMLGIKTATMVFFRNTSAPVATQDRS